MGATRAPVTPQHCKTPLRAHGCPTGQAPGAFQLCDLGQATKPLGASIFSCTK